jgi:hypothetical protein
MPRLESATLPRHDAPRPLIALFAAALTLAVVGAYLASGVFAGGDGHTAAQTKQPEPKSGFAVGDSVFTSFGAVAIETVEKNKGLTAKNLSGAVHGIQNLVPRGKTQLQLFSTMTNLTGKTVEYSPAQWSLLVGSKDAKPLPLVRASIKPGVLQPSAAIDARLTFVVPSNGQQLWARFKDPARDKPFLIDLGRVSKTGKGAIANVHTNHR